MKRILISLILISSLVLTFACQTPGGNNVRIGVFMSLTGTTANFGISSVNGIKLAADEVNAADAAHLGLGHGFLALNHGPPPGRFRPRSGWRRAWPVGGR